MRRRKSGCIAGRQAVMKYREGSMLSHETVMFVKSVVQMVSMCLKCGEYGKTWLCSVV